MEQNLFNHPQDTSASFLPVHWVHGKSNFTPSLSFSFSFLTEFGIDYSRRRYTVQEAQEKRWIYRTGSGATSSASTDRNHHQVLQWDLLRMKERVPSYKLRKRFTSCIYNIVTVVLKQLLHRLTCLFKFDSIWIMLK